MKRLFLLSFTLIFMHLSTFSYASFPVIDTLQIQKETLEEYQGMVNKEGLLNNKNTSVKKKSKFSKFWKAKTIIQKILLIIFGLLLLFVALLLIVIANLEISFDDYDFNLDGL